MCQDIYKMKNEIKENPADNYKKKRSRLDAYFIGHCGIYFNWILMRVRNVCHDAEIFFVDTEEIRNQAWVDFFLLLTNEFFWCMLFVKLFINSRQL